MVYTLKESIFETPNFPKRKSVKTKWIFDEIHFFHFFSIFRVYPKLYVVQTLILFRAWDEYQLQSKTDFNMFALAILLEYH